MKNRSHRNFIWEDGSDFCVGIRHCHSEQNPKIQHLRTNGGRSNKKPITIFGRQITSLLEKRLNIEARLGVKGVLTENDQARYYSCWYFAAIHVALSIGGLQTPDRLASYFNLPRKKVLEVLDFLVEKGLGRRQGASYKIGPKHLHLGNGSANITKHHTNWRTQAVISLDRDMEKDVHYSSVVTLSKADVTKIKDRVIQAIQETIKEIEKSPEEEVYCYAVDLFALGER
jgi:hypothetical protein